MKKALSLILICLSLHCFSQQNPSGTRTNATRGTMTGEEYKRSLGEISDKFYDVNGKVLDSMTVKKMLKTYEYGQSMVTSGGITKRIIQKFPPNQDKQDEYIIKELQPESKKLWMGATFDLTPLAPHLDVAKLNNKALVVIFWTKWLHPYITGEAHKEREALNEITTKYLDTTKFEVIAITHEKRSVAVEEMKNFPIKNAMHVIEAPEVTTFYGTKNQLHILVTDRQHKVIYTMKDWHPMTPRRVNNLLKALK